MSDEEEGYEEEVEAEEAAPVEEKKPSRPRPREEDDGEKPLTETERAMAAAKKRHEEEEAARMQDYEAQRAAQREREEEELRQLKEKQEQRKKQREEEEAMMEDRKREEDERRAREEAARLAKAEEKKKRKEQENKKKQLMFAGQFAEGGGPNFVINKSGEKVSVAFDKSGKKGAAEPTLSKEELEEQKKRVLASLVQPLNLDGLDMDGIRKKIKELHARITKLEADRYDLEKRQEHQEYDHKELIERQKQQIRNKALKKGLDPDEVANAKHPPKVAIASKYDRQIDRRNYGERKELYAKPKKPVQKKIFHGSCRPPSEWGRRKDNEELETLRKNFDGHRYQEAVKLEGVKPPMNPVPAKELPGEDEIEEGPLPTTA